MTTTANPRSIINTIDGTYKIPEGAKIIQAIDKTNTYMVGFFHHPIRKDVIAEFRTDAKVEVGGTVTIQNKSASYTPRPAVASSS